MKTFGKILLLPLALIGIALVEIAVLCIRLYMWVYRDWGKM